MMKRTRRLLKLLGPTWVKDDGWLLHSSFPGSASKHRLATGLDSVDLGSRFREIGLSRRAKPTFHQLQWLFCSLFKLGPVTCLITWMLM